MDVYGDCKTALIDVMELRLFSNTSVTFVIYIYIKYVIVNMDVVSGMIMGAWDMSFFCQIDG